MSFNRKYRITDKNCAAFYVGDYDCTKSQAIKIVREMYNLKRSDIKKCEETYNAKVMNKFLKIGRNIKDVCLRYDFQRVIVSVSRKRYRMCVTGFSYELDLALDILEKEGVIYTFDKKTD